MLQQQQNLVRNHKPFFTHQNIGIEEEGNDYSSSSEEEDSIYPDLSQKPQENNNSHRRDQLFNPNLRSSNQPALRIIRPNLQEFGVTTVTTNRPTFVRKVPRPQRPLNPLLAALSTKAMRSSTTASTTTTTTTTTTTSTSTTTSEEEYEYVYEYVYEYETTAAPSLLDNLLSNHDNQELVPGGLLDNAINSRKDVPERNDEYSATNQNLLTPPETNNDRGPLPDPDYLPDVTDDLRRQIFLEGRTQPVVTETENNQDRTLLLGDQSVDPEQLAYILIGVCVGLSILCLIVVAVTIGYKSETHYRFEGASNQNRKRIRLIKASSSEGSTSNSETETEGG